jgi:ribosomal protein L11 methyltransferase
LAILAGMKGARPITAIDIDPWAYENCMENVRRNGQDEIEVLQGDVTTVRGRHFDVVLANINKNVLLAQLGAYAGLLTPGGTLILSGFYGEDLSELQETARKEGLRYMDCRQLDDWTAAVFKA